jgi:hypothetical protein
MSGRRFPTVILVVGGGGFGTIGNRLGNILGTDEATLCSV